MNKIFVIKYSVDHPRFADSARLELQVEEDGALSTVVGAPGVWCQTCGARVEDIVWEIFLGELDLIHGRFSARVCQTCKDGFAPADDPNVIEEGVK